MPFIKRHAALIAVIASLIAASDTFAQISSINSAFYFPRQYNDVPDSTLTVVRNFPSLIEFDDQFVSKATGFANRHVWRFSNDNGVSPYRFGNDEFFTVTMSLTLTGDPISPRKEAGFVLTTVGGEGSFIVNTDGHEVVAFGGPLPFYAFPRTFQSGDTIQLGITYFLNGNGKRAAIYSANCLQSPPLEFSNLEQGITDNSALGGYLQVVNAPSIATNSGSAEFENISVGGPDQDFDGVPDADDACAATPQCTAVNTGGCSIDQLVPCAGPASGGKWKNHGEYVAAVSQVVEQLLEEGSITDDQADAILLSAAQSACGGKK
ncbi:MAG TPA: hypothetical protein VFW45_06695 [Candidatus Polarisedimenticolia bacterium]|nr:hypothetical protein [Candidatus Polarisedimenticolia bacterium]